MWTARMQKWTETTCRNHLWRVKPDFELDDLLQEAMLVRERVRTKYTGVSQQHFWALYRTSLIRRFATLSNLRTERPSFAVSQGGDGMMAAYENQCAVLPDQHRPEHRDESPILDMGSTDWRIMLSQLDPDTRKGLTAFLWELEQCNGPTLKHLVRKNSRGRIRTRETHFELVQRWLLRSGYNNDRAAQVARRIVYFLQHVKGPIECTP